MTIIGKAYHVRKEPKPYLGKFMCLASGVAISFGLLAGVIHSHNSPTKPEKLEVIPLKYEIDIKIAPFQEKNPLIICGLEKEVKKS